MKDIYQNWKPDNQADYLYELEASIMATCIFYPGAIVDVRENVDPAAFSGRYMGLYLSIIAMMEEGERINKTSISARVVASKKNSPDINALFENYTIIKDLRNLKDYCYKVQEQYEREKMRLILEGALLDLKTANSVAGLASVIETRLTEIGQVNIAPTKTIGVAIREALDEGIKNRDRKEVSLGNGRLDNYTGGLMGGKLWYISGRSGTGKTSVIVHLFKTIAGNGTPVAMFSMEMLAKEIGGKAASDDMKVTRRDIMKGKFDPLSSNVLAGLDINSNLPFYIVDNISDIDTICGKMAELAKKYGVKAVAIDYLGLVKHKSDEELYAITSRLKQEAMRLDIDIFLLVQMTKAAAGQKPTNVQLRYVDVQDADIVMLIYKDAYDDNQVIIPEEHADVHSVVWEITKNRTLGILGAIKLVYDNEFDRFYNSLDDYKLINNPTPPAPYDPSAGMNAAGRGQNLDTLPF